MFVIGNWYFTNPSRRVVLLDHIQHERERAWVIDMNNLQAGWIRLENLDADNAGITEAYNLRNWQPVYPVDEYLED